MKLVVQRVNKAKVIRVSDQKVEGQIGKGLFVLVGFKKGDTQEVVQLMAAKLIKLRVMSGEQGENYSPERSRRMNLSVLDVKGEFLIVSQFTLYADTSGGNRPSFINAEEQEKAKLLYDLFVEKIKFSGIKTETGSFGDYMKIDTELDGPVTIVLEA